MHLGWLQSIPKPVLDDAYCLLLEIVGYAEVGPLRVSLVASSSELSFLLHIDVLRVSGKLIDLFFLSSDEL